MNRVKMDILDAHEDLLSPLRSDISLADTTANTESSIGTPNFDLTCLSQKKSFEFAKNQQSSQTKRKISEPFTDKFFTPDSIKGSNIGVDKSSCSNQASPMDNVFNEKISMTLQTRANETRTRNKSANSSTVQSGRKISEDIVIRDTQVKGSTPTGIAQHKRENKILTFNADNNLKKHSFEDLQVENKSNCAKDTSPNSKKKQTSNTALKNETVQICCDKSSSKNGSNSLNIRKRKGCEKKNDKVEVKENTLFKKQLTSMEDSIKLAVSMEFDTVRSHLYEDRMLMIKSTNKILDSIDAIKLEQQKLSQRVDYLGHIFEQQLEINRKLLSLFNL